MSKSRVETWGSATGANRIPLPLSHRSRVLRICGVHGFPGFRLQLNPGLILSIPSGDTGAAHVDASIVGLEGQHNRNPGWDDRINDLHTGGVRQRWLPIPDGQLSPVHEKSPNSA